MYSLGKFISFVVSKVQFYDLSLLFFISKYALSLIAKKLLGWELNLSANSRSFYFSSASVIKTSVFLLEAFFLLLLYGSYFTSSNISSPVLTGCTRTEVEVVLKLVDGDII